MAVKPPAAPAAEMSERDYQNTINRAVQDTEEEIFSDALGTDELDNDGDTSLEDMGEGLEGEVEETEPEEEADEEEQAEAEEGEGDEPETDEAEAEEGEEQEPERDERGRFQRQDDRRIPPGRLRQEADQRRAAEERANTLERQLAEMNGRLAELSARQNASQPKPQQQERPPKPDMFSDPEGYERWVLEEAERRADDRLQRGFAQFEQRQQQMSAQRVDQSLAEAASGPRGFEFSAAYGALTRLSPNDPAARATVARIYNSNDPAAALFDWWENNGGPEYRDQILQQLMPQQPRQRMAPQNQPRHVIRPPQRLPSLNSATGSNRQQTADPEMLDGSEAGIFAYGSRR